MPLLSFLVKAGVSVGLLACESAESTPIGVSPSPSPTVAPVLRTESTLIPKTEVIATHRTRFLRCHLLGAQILLENPAGFVFYQVSFILQFKSSYNLPTNCFSDLFWCLGDPHRTNVVCSQLVYYSAMHF